MNAWALGLLLAGLLHAAQLELDCARPATARALIGRIKLSEIEWAEDVNRAAMWDAFGRCAALPQAEACRERERRRFTDDLDRQKATIEAKYQRMLEDFEERCRASIA
jgi:hypothetical protein